MNQQTALLVEELKQSGEDFEWYPTSREMIQPIWEDLGKVESVLDIGCGTCNFKKYIEEFNQIEKADKSNYDNYGDFKGTARCFKYYVMEKSRILIDRLDKETIVLGTDFNQNTLIDKKVDAIFCNPPYSEYENWMKRIISEGNCKYIYLIVPQRWKENAEINGCIEDTKARVKVLGSFDFLHAERQARAKVDVLVIDKRKHSDYSGFRRELDDINEDAFDKFFDETFKMRDKVSQHEYDVEKEHKESIKTSLVGCESKAKMLVDLYQHEQKTFFEHFKAISTLDVDILETIGVKKESVKSALKQKIKSLKILYWELIFDELDEITSRLTSKTRKRMLDRFKELLTVDFTIENIYPLIIWVIKNANSYYNEQLIDFFKQLSSPENVKMYKSNQRVFQQERWRFADNHSHYTLDYRIVCRHIFKTTYGGELDKWENEKRINDICTIANNLGFETGWQEKPLKYGEKYTVHMADMKTPLFEYRVYRNGNTHIKLNKEFCKAMNVEVSRLLGWIRSKEDISKEFPEELAKGADKYFKTNKYLQLGNNIKLLSTNSQHD